MPLPDALPDPLGRAAPAAVAAPAASLIDSILSGVEATPEARAIEMVARIVRPSVGESVGSVVEAPPADAKADDAADRRYHSALTPLPDVGLAMLKGDRVSYTSRAGRTATYYVAGRSDRYGRLRLGLRRNKDQGRLFWVDATRVSVAKAPSPTKAVCRFCGMVH